MSGYGFLKYFHSILDKKDPPEDKELLNPSEPLYVICCKQQIKVNISKSVIVTGYRCHIGYLIIKLNHLGCVLANRFDLVFTRVG